MQMPSFLPHTNQVDRLSQFFALVTRMLLVAGIALLPIIFVPGLTTLTGALKTYLVVGVLLLAVVFYSLAVLRRGEVRLRFPYLITTWWGLVLTGMVAGLMAPQVGVALWGAAFEIHTVGFLVVLGAVMTMMLLFRESKYAIVYLFSGLFISAFILSTLHIARLLLGPEWLSFGLLASPAATLVGSFNDLALFLALVVMVGLISLLQLHMPKLIEIALTAIVTLSMVMLGVINFFAVWIVLGLFGLLLLMYTLTNGRIGTPRSLSTPSIVVTILSLLVFVVSLVFIIGGTSLGAVIANKTGISYLEVRPSFTATLDILRATYGQNAFTGAGPNHFNEVWTQFKDQSLNLTVFWNTAFNAGNGYIPTWFVTGGILMVLAWVIFLAFFVREGVRTLLRPAVNDNFWFFIATISFTVSFFVLAMSLIYVPGPVILILGFANIGLFVVASEMLTPRQVRTVNLLTNSKTGFVLIATVMIIIVSSVGAGYQLFHQVLGLTSYAKALEIPAGDNQVAEVTAAVVRAYAFHPNDAFVRDLANYQLREMQLLAIKPEPTTADTQRFGVLVTAALEASTVAINERPSDARNWTTRADVYTTLASADVEGAYDRAVADYNEARTRDPQNPYYDLQMAILELSKDNRDGARAALEIALQKKANYTDALVLLAQLDIAAGNLDEAIRTTTSLVSLEANNPGRYYQLGILYSAKREHETAIEAFSQAIALNPQFANARYLRALELLTLNRKDEAVSELVIVRDLNPDNTSVEELIGRIERGEVTAETLKKSTQTTAVAEPSSVTTNENEVITTDTAPDTNLISPVNAVPGTSTSTPSGE